MLPQVKRIIRDVKNLKIQGARNVAKAVIKAIFLEIKNSEAKSINEFYSEMLEVADALAGIRPTEPMTRNYINEILGYTMMLIKTKKGKLKDIKESLLKEEDKILKKMRSAKEKIADYGAKLIPKNAVVMTYCHSSTVIGILKRAYDLGKNITVYACETRPRFQGRITAKELAQHGIDTTLIVDGAMNMFMKKVDICLVGADAITSRGDLINKIGTSTLAHIARMHDVSFYSAAEIYKYDPITLYGNREKIEERDLKEVWERPPRKVKIRNPAFDVTAARYINGYITEYGIVPPTGLFSLVEEKLKRR